MSLEWSSTYRRRWMAFSRKRMRKNMRRRWLVCRTLFRKVDYFLIARVELDVQCICSPLCLSSIFITPISYLKKSDTEIWDLSLYSIQIADFVNEIGHFLWQIDSTIKKVPSVDLALAHDLDLARLGDVALGNAVGWLALARLKIANLLIAHIWKLDLI